MTVPTTYTRTHVYTAYANPYLICSLCRQPVTGQHHDDATACGCEMGNWLMPCMHPAGSMDTCPSWSPVDGCQCSGKHVAEVADV